MDEIPDDEFVFRGPVYLVAPAPIPATIAEVVPLIVTMTIKSATKGWERIVPVFTDHDLALRFIERNQSTLRNCLPFRGGTLELFERLLVALAAAGHHRIGVDLEKTHARVYTIARALDQLRRSTH